MVRLDIKAKTVLLVATLLLIHLGLLIWTNFTAWPEMLAWPYLVNNGFLPYKNIAMAHNPLLIVGLAFFYLLFGTGVIQLQIFTWTLILVTDLLVFFSAKRLYGLKTAFLAEVVYILLNLIYEGNGLWFDLALAPICLLIFYSLKEKKIVLSGILWALAFLTKQTALWFLVPIGYSLFQLKREIKFSVIQFLGGAVSVFMLFFIVVLALKLHSEYYQWAVDYAMFKLPNMSGQIQLPSLTQFSVAFLPFAIILSVIRNRTTKELVVWAVFLVLGLYPRWELFHFQPALPFLALLYGILISEKSKGNLTKLFGRFCVLGIVIIFILFLSKNMGKTTRFYDASTQAVVNKVTRLVGPNSRIYVANYPDSLYPLTGTIPGVSILVPHLQWYLEQEGIQERLVDDLKRNPAELVVVGEYTPKGLSSYRPKILSDFLFSEYEEVESIENVILLKEK